MTARRTTLTPEENARARVLPQVDRAKRIAAMLERWIAEDAADEPEWDVGDLARVALRSPSAS